MLLNHDLIGQLASSHLEWELAKLVPLSVNYPRQLPLLAAIEWVLLSPGNLRPHPRNLFVRGGTLSRDDCRVLAELLKTD